MTAEFFSNFYILHEFIAVVNTSLILNLLEVRYCRLVYCSCELITCLFTLQKLLMNSRGLSGELIGFSMLVIKSSANNKGFSPSFS
jgi:hypothetical protein